MTFDASLILLVLCGLLLLIAAGRNVRRRRVGRGLVCGITALVLFFGAAGAGLISMNLTAYERLGTEQSAGEVQFTQIGTRNFDGAFTFPSGERADFALRGDEWQIDARILKWRPFANLIGFDSAYRLDRISGRYTRLEDETSQPRTVYALHTPERIDLWALLHAYSSWIPGVDALYGSAAFLPMADGARYEVKVTQSGLLARPLNAAASTSVAGWH